MRRSRLSLLVHLVQLRRGRLQACWELLTCSSSHHLLVLKLVRLELLMPLLLLLVAIGLHRVL